MKEKKKVGRPTKYKPEYCDLIIEFFSEQPESKMTERGHISVTGKLPTFESFATKLQVSVDTLHEWRTVHTDFSEAYTRAKAMQRDAMMQHGLTGAYNPAFTKFLLSANHGMHETSNQNVNAEVKEVKTFSDMYDE